MDKKNYRESLEKDRQEIITDNTSNLSRRALRQKENKKPEKRRNFLLPVLFFIFILIPVTILIYVALIYEPDDTLVGSGNENQVSVESNTPPTDSSVIVPEETEEEVAEESTEDEEAKEKAEKEKAEQEAKEKTAKEKAEQEAKEKAEKEAREKTEAEAKEKAEQEARDKAEAAKNEKEPEEPSSSGGKTVVVQDNETLYRIAVNNYGASGAGAAVEKIKQANGLSSNEIYAGQTLILP